MLLCLEETELDHHRAVVQEKVLDEGEEVEVGWKARVLELDLVEVVSAPIAGQGFLTKSEFPAII